MNVPNIPHEGAAYAKKTMWSFFHVIMDNDLEMIEMPSFVIHSICCISGKFQYIEI